MNIYSGIVKGQKFATNRDGKTNVRILDVEIESAEDVQTIEQVLYAGDDTGAIIDSTVYILEISPSYKVAIGLNDGIVPEVDEGEKKLYSQANGTIKASIYLKNDGSIDVTGTGDIAVQNDNGFFKLLANGQFNANDNFTVDA